MADLEELKKLAEAAGKKWHLGSMNDGLFIINAPPRPSGTDAPPQLHRDGPTMVLNVTELPDAKAQALCDAHNAALPALIEMVEKAEAENARMREALASAKREGVDEALELAKEQAKLMADITADFAIYGDDGNSRQREAMEAALTRYAQNLEYTLAALGRQS